MAGAARKKQPLAIKLNELNGDQVSTPNIKTANEIVGLLLKTGMSVKEAWDRAGTLLDPQGYTPQNHIGIMSEQAYIPESRKGAMAVATKSRSNGHTTKEYPLRRTKLPEGMTFEAIVARALIRLRYKKGLNGKAMGKELGVELTTYYRLEKGASAGLAGEQITHVCRKLGGSVPKGVMLLMDLGAPPPQDGEGEI